MNFDEFLEKHQKVPIVEFTNKVPKSPIVSVCVQTYQQASYIKECLEGILMQETDFPYEILLGEDDSNDGTREICIEYAQKYPDKIRLFLHDRENNIQIHGYPTGRFNYLNNIFSSNGKYIAVCEGDDYWIDPLKLQKQIDILEKNVEYGLVHTNCHYLHDKKKIVIKNNNTAKLNNKNNLSESELFYGLITSNYKIITATVVFKKELLDSIFPAALKFGMLDTPLWLYFSKKTKFYFLDTPSSMYRVLENSASRSKNLARYYRFRLSMVEMRLYFIRKYNYIVSPELKNKYNSTYLNYIMFDRKFKPYYPLFNPTKLDTFREFCSRKLLLNWIVILLWHLNGKVNSLLRSIYYTSDRK